MPQTKCNCSNCKRLIDIHLEACPFCRTPNNYLKNKEQTANNNSKPDTPNKPVQKIHNISIEEMNSILSDSDVENNTSKTEEIKKESTFDSIDEEEYEEFSPYQSEIENDIKENPIVSELESSETASEDFTVKVQAATKKKKIAWTDEKPKEEPDYSKMYDEQGQYNANFDGYYNDTRPKIANEIDRTLAGREKAVLKVIFAIVAIVAIIVYLILTI